jgi:hypothetical protein
MTQMGNQAVDDGSDLPGIANADELAAILVVDGFAVTILTAVFRQLGKVIDLASSNSAPPWTCLLMRSWSSSLASPGFAALLETLRRLPARS